MDNYQGYKDFITSYEIDEDNQSMVIQFADRKETKVVNSSHNINVVDRRLYKQHQELMKSVASERKKENRGYIVPILFNGAIGSFCLMDTPIITVSALIFILGYVREICRNNKVIRRLELTDYCLQNADLIRLIRTESVLQPKLSEQGKNAFEKDNGFTLNHAHLYTDNDLKELKKALRK